MNTQDYRNVMDQLKPAPSLEARIKEQLGRPSRRPHPRRMVGKIAVAVLAAACTFMVAMAVSPQLRAAVLTFFHLEETEQVPPPVSAPINSDPSMITQDLIAQQVEAQYIHLPGLSGYDYGNGVLFQAQRDDYGAILDFRYWAAEGDTLVPLETHTTDFTTTWDGITYTDTVYWCVYDGAISCYCNGRAGMAADADCVVSSLPGSTDSVILRLSQGSQMDYRQYPVLLDLTTGEVTDLLGGTGWEKAAPVREVQWADDLSAAILSNDRTGWFYCDRTAKTTTHLDELTGLDVFSAYFANNTLILLTQSGPEGDCYDIWTWQPDSGTLTQTFSQLHIYRERDDNPYGFQFLFGSTLGLYITPEGRLSVLDLCTGQETPVEGFSLTQWDSTFLPNPSGSKILFADYDNAADSLGIARLGVIDLTRGTFTVLDREGYDALNEGSLSWFDENRVAIQSSQKEDYTECYLYLYRF